MLIALVLTALSLHPSPAKAGAQYRTDRTWAPAFAGERKKDKLDEQSGPARPGAMSPIDAERAFAADAQTLGQWTAFRKWSTDDAVMFVPQPTNAHAWLKDRKDPAKAIEWWPTASYVSCDGTLAVNVGGWKRPNGSVGSFATVWTKQRAGSWRWLMDTGEDRTTAPPRPVKPKIVKASCGGKAVIDIGGFVDITLYRSADQTLFAGWDKEASSFFMNRWTGNAYHYATGSDVVGR